MILLIVRRTNMRASIAPSDSWQIAWWQYQDCHSHTTGRSSQLTETYWKCPVVSIYVPAISASLRGLSHFIIGDFNRDLFRLCPDGKGGTRKTRGRGTNWKWDWALIYNWLVQVTTTKAKKKKKSHQPRWILIETKWGQCQSWYNRTSHSVRRDRAGGIIDCSSANTLMLSRCQRDGLYQHWEPLQI